VSKKTKIVDEVDDLAVPLTSSPFASQEEACADDEAIAKALQAQLEAEDREKEKRESTTSSKKTKKNTIPKTKKSKKSKKNIILMDDDDPIEFSGDDNDDDDDFIDYETEKHRPKGKPDYIIKTRGSKPVCEYGDRCYRKNAEHFLEFYHPSRDDSD